LLFVWLRPIARTPEIVAELQSVLIPADLRSVEAEQAFEVPISSSALRIDLAQVYPSPLRTELREAGTQSLLCFVQSPGSQEFRVMDQRTIELFSREPSFVLTADPGETLAPGRYACSVWLVQDETARLETRFAFRLVTISPD
jgi:hypothetical protein